MESIYRQLQRKLHTIGSGLPESDKGHELVCLEELFTPEEAQFALKMDLGLRSAKEVAESMGISEEEASERLQSMSERGLLYRVQDEGIVKYYLITAYHGYMEFNVNRVTPLLTQNLGKHFGKGLGKIFYGAPHPLFRFIPLRAELVENGECLDYDDPEAIINRQEKLALTKCFCRLVAEMNNGGPVCKRNPPESLEVCMMFNEFADFYLENGIAREITKQEALEIIRKCDANGTAVEILNTTNPQVMCSCCSCCCGVIMAHRAFGGASADYASNYVSSLEGDGCTKCGLCAKRCPTRAVRLSEDGELTYNPKKCLGCGLCVTTCPTKSRKLFRKPEEKVYAPTTDTYAGLNDLLRSERRARGDI
jgi:Pyruvate/2-oxoacid:ferredoxin oxidoreductase delta subunit